MRSIAVIPARGNSKRVPCKNKKLIAGKPMVMWAMIAAYEANIFDEIYLTSEDPEILDMAFSGITPFERSERLSGDLVAQWEPVAEVARHTNSADLVFVDAVCMVTSVCPLTTPGLLRETAVAFEQSDKRQLATVIPARHGWMASEAVFGNPANGLIQKLDYGNLQSTELPPLYIPSGNVRWWKYKDVLDSDPILATGTYNADTYGYLIPEDLAVDVDTPFDFKIAELLLNQRRASEAVIYS